jgi:hypothetical protein
MGYGEYSHAAHVALTSTRPASEPLFAQRGCHPLMQPHEAVRESRDSTDHPDSLGVVFALDVTGSMGEIPRQLATRTLPDFMRVLLDAGVRDPALCFMAVGHAGQDAAPLQVGQFESSERLIDLWLTRMWLEGGGAGGHEAYELAMYFAARRMQLDSVHKRGRRGFLFLTGDVAPNPAVSRVQVQRLIGDVLAADLPIRQMVEELQRTFEPFFLIAPGAARGSERAWRDLLGDRVIALNEAEDAAYVAAGLVALLEGSASSLGALVDRLETTGLPRKHRARIAQALVPFAASIGRDGAPKVGVRQVELPRGDPPSGLVRRTG